VLNWLKSLPTMVLDARPSLWMSYASALMMTGQHTAVEEKLQAAEAALPASEPDAKTRDLVGRIASMRATVAVMQHDIETLLAQSRRALEFLHPDNLPLRTAATYTLGFAYQLQGERAAASRAYAEVIAISKSFGPSIYTTAATTCLGQVQESDNQLYLAAETYRHALVLAGDPPRPIACEAQLGLARIYYQWNDLEAAQQHGQQCLLLMRQMESVDTFASYGVFLAHLKLAQGDLPGAVAILTEAQEFIRRHNFVFRLRDVAAAQALTLLRQGHLAEAAHLVQAHDLPLSQARLHLAQGNPSTALAVLEKMRRQAEARDWQDERLKVTVLQALALHAQGEKDQALQRLAEALAMAEPGGFVRSFIDEGPTMAALLREAAKHPTAPAYIRQLQAAFGKAEGITPLPQLLIEPLSERELEVLRMLGTELNGPELARELMVSLNTLRTHTKNIYNKLGVHDRRAAYRRAGELNLL
jgi:LuxR family maltose regulon positive regulatory protein